jgi:AcrR family transcriptional regulator
MGTGWDDRQERTRAHVLVAAGQLIAGDGVDGLSMRRLAERAGVSVGTIYNQFGDRDGVLVAFVSQGLDELELRLDAEPTAGPLDTTRLIFEALDDTIAESVDIWRPVFAVIKSNPDLAGLGQVGDRFIAIVEHDLAKAAADGMFTNEIDVGTLAGHIFITRMTRLEKWAVGTIDWAEYRSSSRLGLELSLAAVLAEPHALDARVRSGLLTG